MYCVCATIPKHNTTLVPARRGELLPASRMSQAIQLLPIALWISLLNQLPALPDNSFFVSRSKREGLDRMIVRPL